MTDTKAMSLQEKERILLEQSKIDNLFWTENEFEAILRTIDSCLAAQKAELENVKSEREQFRQSIGRTAEDYLLQITRQKEHIELLKSSITQEKEKAFDELKAKIQAKIGTFSGMRNIWTDGKDYAYNDVIDLIEKS